MPKSLISTDLQDGDKLAPIYPGEVLRAEFLEPLKLSVTELANHMGVSASGIIAIVNDAERRAITAETALRLSYVFRTSVEFWLNLQMNYDLAMLDYSGDNDKIRKQVRELAP